MLVCVIYALIALSYLALAISHGMGWD